MSQYRTGMLLGTFRSKIDSTAAKNINTKNEALRIVKETCGPIYLRTTL